MIEHTGTAEWWKVVDLQRSKTDAIEKAEKEITDEIEDTNDVLTTGKVVGQVNLGFWVRLFSSAYDKTLWSQHLKHLFPKGTRRTQILARLKNLNTLRNRIAHHQRIIGGKRDLLQDYTDLVDTISWFSPEIALWVSKTNCFIERVQRKPRKLPKPEKPKSPEPPQTAAAGA
jgi:hypothetical protein